MLLLAVLLPAAQLALSPPVSGSSSSWSAVASMPGPRSGLGAATGSDGRIYAVGGFDGEVSIAKVGAYQPSSHSWSPVGPLSVPRAYLAAAAGGDGRIYAIGGELVGVASAVVEAYSPGANTWAAVPPLLTARTRLAAATGANGQIYAIGGCCDSQHHALGTVEAYTPGANGWVSLAPMPRARWGLAAALGPDGRIYAAGGCCDSTSNPLRTVEAYDPATNTWTCSVGDTSPGCSSTTLAPMQTAREGLALITGRDNRIYAIGGGNSRAHTSLKTVEVYDPATNRWTSASSMGQARFYPGATLGWDGRIYTLGGAGASPVLQSVEAYSPSAALPSATKGTVKSATPTPKLAATPTATPSGNPTVAPPVMEPTKTPIPIKAFLAARSIRPGAEEMVVVQTLSAATVMARIVYAVSGGFKTHGTTTSSGRWQHRWKVNARHPGPALVKLLVLHGQDHRYYTLHFTVI